MSEKKRDLKLRTPGEPVAAKSMPPQADDQDIAIAEVDAELAAAEIVGNMEADVEARIEAEVLRRLKALQKVKPKNPLAQAADLPHSHEVDATKIKRAVLTQQGYVVPVPPPAKVVA